MAKRPAEFDVYISCAEADRALAQQIAAGLTRKGFRVNAGGATPDTGAKVIEEAPDFVLLLTPATDSAGATESARETAVALGAQRNIIPVLAGGSVPTTGGLNPDDFVRRYPPIGFDSARAAEGIALVGHRLTSSASREDRQVDRQAKWMAWIVGLVVLGIITVGGLRTLPRMMADYALRPLPPFVVYWSAFGQRAQNGGWTEVRVDGAPLSQGDQLAISFSASADGFAYVMSRDVRGVVTLLFPVRGTRNGGHVTAGQLYTAPVGGGWFTPDSAPLDTIYLVAGYDQLDNLEALVEEREEESSVDARKSLLESTIAGLLDGKHGFAGASTRTRSGRPVVHYVDVPRQTVSTAHVTLSNGTRISHPLTREQGLLSAEVEIKFR